jgi:hypothetical protein
MPVVPTQDDCLGLLDEVTRVDPLILGGSPVCAFCLEPAESESIIDPEGSFSYSRIVHSYDCLWVKVRLLLEGCDRTRDEIEDLGYKAPGPRHERAVVHGVAPYDYGDPE